MLVDTQKLVSPERFTLLFSTMQMPVQASVFWLKYTTGSNNLNFMGMSSNCRIDRLSRHWPILHNQL